MKVKMRKSQSQIFFGNTLCQQLILTALDPHLELLNPTLDKEDNISQIFLKNTISEFKDWNPKTAGQKLSLLWKERPCMTSHDGIGSKYEVNQTRSCSESSYFPNHFFILSKLDLGTFKSFTTSFLYTNLN